MSEKFSDFVKKKVESVQEKEFELDLDEEKAVWLKKLDELYALIQGSLAEHIAANQIRVDFTEISLTEELLGTYNVQEARITVGKDVVILKPVGTFLIAARGRVDMVGPRGNTRFVIVPPNSRAPRVRVTILEPGETAPSSEPYIPPRTWVWKIATPPPRVAYIDLTFESFQDALMGVIDG